MKNFRRSFIIVLTICFFLTSAAFASDRVTITILGTSDIHGQLFSYSYETGQIDERGGMDKLSTIVKKIRKENPNVILVDNGDTIQGTPLTDDLFNTIWADEPHPIIKGMNLMKYDAMALGNHEFNFGLDLISKIKKEADFPILGANIFNRNDGSYYAEPYAIVEREGIKIGIIGSVIPSVPVWDGPRVTSLKFKAIAPEIKKVYKKLIQDHEVDLVIATSHSGLDGNRFDDGTKARYIAEKIPDLGALIIGHDHKTVDKTINNVPVIGTRNAGREISRVDIVMKRTPQGWEISERRTEIIEALNYKPDPEFVENLKEAHERTVEFINAKAAFATGDFLPDFYFEHEHLPVALFKDTALVDLIHRVQLHFVPDAQISGAALFFPDSNLKKGPITYSNIFDIYRYPNTLVGVKISGKELKDYIEWSARFYKTYKPGDLTLSFDPNIRSYNYDTFQGVEYLIDVSQPPGSRIKELTYNGKPVLADQTFNIAINNYRYSGMKNMGRLSNDAYFTSDPKSVRSYIFDYVSELEKVEPEVDHNWKIIGASFNHWAREHAIRMVNRNVIPVVTGNRVFNIERINLNDSVDKKSFFKSLSVLTEKQYDESLLSDEYITRSQALKYIYNETQVKIKDHSSLEKFADYETFDDQSKHFLAIVTEYGIFQPCETGNLNPDQYLTRGEKAQILDYFDQGIYKN